MAVLAPAAARRDGWAVGLTLDLVGTWGDSGQRVVLADGVLEHPMLHREIGLPSEEGISDAALFGASVARVARPVPGRSFFFVSAGSPTGNPDSVAGSPRWHRLRNGFKDAGVTLVLFVREGCAAEEELTRESDDVVVLAGSAEDVPPSARRMADKVRVVLGPRTEPASAAESDLERGPEPQPEPQAESVPDPEPALDPLPTEATGPERAYDAFEGFLDDDAVVAEPGDGPDASSASDAPDDSLHFGETDDPALSEDASQAEGASINDTRGLNEAAVQGAPSTSSRTPPGGADAGAPGGARQLRYAPVQSSRRKRTSDSGTGRKLLWAGIVLVAVIMLAVLLGGLGPG